MIDNLKNLLFALDIQATVNVCDDPEMVEFEGIDPHVELKFETDNQCLQFIEAMNGSGWQLDVSAQRSFKTFTTKPAAFIWLADLETVCEHLQPQAAAAAVKYKQQYTALAGEKIDELAA